MAALTARSAVTVRSTAGVRSTVPELPQGNLPRAIGVYLHVPFCQKKCYYCDFNTYAGLAGLAPAYLAALRREIVLRAGQQTPLGVLGERPVRSVFIGGGTPTVLSGAELAGLLAALQEHFNVLPDAELTVEANPGTIDAAKLAALRAAGVNRLSLGAQTFDAARLERLGRIHAPDDVRAGVAAARQAGFQNVSIDLIFGLPEQTVADWERDLAEAVALQPDHISAYSLIIEPGTPFHAWHEAGRLPVPDDDTVADMLAVTRQRLLAAGYEPYEISNYARPGRRSVHNQIYWRNEEYVGLGCGAVSYVGGRREMIVRDPVRYIEALTGPGAAAPDEAPAATGDAALGVPLAEADVVDRETAMAETVMLGLRLRDGLSDHDFYCRFGRRLGDTYRDAIARHTRLGLLEWDGERLRLTERGIGVANQVIVDFMP